MFAVCLTDCLQKTDEVGEMTQSVCWLELRLGHQLSDTRPVSLCFLCRFLSRVGFQSMYQLFPLKQSTGRLCLC